MKIILLLCLLNLTYAEDKKIYSEKEFSEKLEKEISRIKKSSIASLTKEIYEKEILLKKQEEEIKKQQEQVQMNEKTLAQKITEFEIKQSKVLGCVDENKNKAQKRIEDLVSMISNMKPLKAADILSVQDSQISIKILEKIDPKKASKIFNLMDKEVSARLQKQYLDMRR